MSNRMQLEMANFVSLNGNEIRIVLVNEGTFEVKIVYKNGDRREATHETLTGMFAYIEEMIDKHIVIELRRQMLEAVTDTQSVIDLRNQLFRMEKLETVLNFQREIETYDEVSDARE